jgi:hypothetical protein
MTLIAGLLLLAALLAPQPAAAAGPLPSDLDIIGACRDTFPDVEADPNAEGGWRLFDSGDRRFLCLYGSLASDKLPGLLPSVDPGPALTVAVRSTGGPAASWLELAEHLRGTEVELLIDEACFSSCANYLPVVARSIRAVENSLLVWHGGPNESLDPDTELSMANLFEIIAYDAVSRRTRTLYDKKGVSIELLRVSTLQTDAKVMSRLIAEAKLTGGALAVAGYAFSPATLAQCFGLTAAQGMWHAGGDADLIRLAQRRSATLLVLESPRTKDGLRICRADSTPPLQPGVSPPQGETEQHSGE